MNSADATKAQPHSGEIITAVVHKGPRYSVFLTLGALVGLLAAVILMSLADYSTPQVGGLAYTPGQVFGFFVLWTVAAGIALGGGVALIIDRASRAKAKTVLVQHERIYTVPDHGTEVDHSDAAEPSAEADINPAPETTATPVD